MAQYLTSFEYFLILPLKKYNKFCKKKQKTKPKPSCGVGRQENKKVIALGMQL